MIRVRVIVAAAGILLAGVMVTSASAQIPVTDVGAIADLVSQLQTLEHQVATAEKQLEQAQQEYQAKTGGRGMEQLLSGTPRNYLPATWPDVRSSFAAGIGAAVSNNAVLSNAQVSALSPGNQLGLAADRRSAALQQLLAQQALATTSARFAALQKLIDAIPTAVDQKGVLDLQARIGSEQVMLLNEQSKLQLLNTAAQADDLVNRQRSRELQIAAQGQFSSRFQPTP